ncbi:helix-turn-helix domain-containing protein [Nevskia sp.]|uniref:helix-turn-helix domain-containing protein n=1 Tax=Nevskia sp. TaxID=1929292 RepID=UPI0025F24D87|nr:helix-turn-helix domain-containing protein [Nevskia sp.]
MTSENAAPRRKRQSGVRGRILDLLSSGPMLAQDILDKGGFSPASLYLNLKALKSDGSVDTTREGRAVRYALTGTPGTEGEPVAAAKPAKGKRGRKPKGTVKAVGGKIASASGDLKDALGVLMARLSPIENASEKMMVLSQLAGSLPAPVAKILNSVIDDLGRLAGKR